MPSRTKRPWVSANFATTWDGKITTRNHTPSDFSSPRDKHRLLEIRALADAVIVSAKTAGADRMTMGLPDADLRAARVARGQLEYPVRVLLSNSGKIDPGLRVFEENCSPILIFSTEQMPPKVRAALASRAALHLTEGKSVDLTRMLERLRDEYGVQRAHCEGGGQVLRAFVEADLLDEIYITLCPRIFGGADAPTITGTPRNYLPASTRLELTKVEQIADECFLQYRVLR